MPSGHSGRPVRQRVDAQRLRCCAGGGARICSFSNPVSHRGPPTCYNTSRLTRCHRAVVSNSCHFFRRPLPIPLATYAIGEGRGQPVRKVPSRDGYPRASSLVVERWREMRAQQHSASRITDRGFSDIHVQKALLVGCAPSHFTGSGMSRHHADRHPPSPLDRRESNVDDGRGRVPGQRARGGINYNRIFDGLSAGPVALLALSKAL
jgi:hypothetical protein